MESKNRRDYERRINRALDYIQRHLGEEITLEQLAAEAAFSPFHFHRVFSALVGEPVGAFIRRVRLETAAARLLSHVEQSITEVALDSGFSSPAVFARAFRERFGVSASEWRESASKDRKALGNEGQALGNRGEAAPLLVRYVPPWEQKAPDDILPRKENTMDVRIEEMPAMRALYVRRFGPYAESSKQAWEALCRWAGPRGLLGPTTIFFGVSHDDPKITEAGRLRYDACIRVGPEVSAEGEVSEMTLPACRVARAHYEGPGEGISAAYAALYGQWLPGSGFVPADLPCFEIYLGDPSGGHFVMDICLPVVPA